ncbi:MAG: MOSC N-terminal beta barrel domain-containing protein [Aggregatilineales bacterium]
MKGSGAIVSALYNYPVKSCAGIAHTSMAFDVAGPLYDRRWVIVEDTTAEIARPVTARTLHKLPLIRQTIEGEALVLCAPGLPKLRLALGLTGGALRLTEVFGGRCWGEDAGDPAARWLSEFLDMEVRLLHMPAGYERPVDARYAQERAVTTFTDGFPLLLIGEGTLDELNAKLAAVGKPALSMLRFRPNIVVSGIGPGEEDYWQRIRIGSLVFDVAKACRRCVMTTVDPERGMVIGEGEPLKTLATYRRDRTGAVVFGQNVVHRGVGSLAIGDPIEVLERADVPNWVDQ